jgi:predicted amidophosphoribosyltransferase
MSRRLVASLLPLRCPGCGTIAEPVCDRCAATMRAAPTAAPPPGVDVWCAPFAYDGVARELVARVKYRGAHAATGWLACEMVALVAPPVPVVVTWAPTTAARRRARGFDHAELLAAAVARLLRRSLRRLLVRGAGDPQTGRAASERRIGPTFSARTPVPASVLLVDDVATTGATAAAAARALRAGGASRVVVLTAARTPAPPLEAAR